ncbi:hypothetical protein [Streptomyces broussonetiae]|uniref:hypothetical protein n=1 Tax=Streptomyces broussonetiae TaxID=2686304 RepID=UPI001E3A57DD|nr:hypothetical protein [Streptomyces broussonetiae]
MEDTIERNVQVVAGHLGIQVRSSWRYFDASALADSLAQSVRAFEDSSPDEEVGQAPLPPRNTPSLP